MIDTDFLKTLTERPSIGTACGPVWNLLKTWFGEGYATVFVPDGFCLFLKKDAEGNVKMPRAVYIAHVDEIGGCVYGRRTEAEGGGFHTRCWGNTPIVFAEATLQAFDYLTEDPASAFPVEGQVVLAAGEPRLVLFGEAIRPYRTGWTFREETVFDGDMIEGKALDPRGTAYAVGEAVRALDSQDVAALFVMAEECAMDVAKKAVTYLQRWEFQQSSPRLELIVNADVPSLANLGDARLDLPAIRIFEGRNFIDPSFGIRMADKLEARGGAFHLSAARSGSQTLLFTPLAPTLSIALPSDGIHLPRYKMSRTGIARCITLLTAIAENAL